MGTDQNWFRLHHLFAAVARAELEAADATRVQDLHGRAAEWFARNGYADEGIHHAVAAGSPVTAAQLVQRNWLRYFSAGRAATIHGWLRAVQASGSDPDPAIMVTRAWMAVLGGDEQELNWTLHFLDGSEDQPLVDGTASVRSAAAIIRGLFGFGGPRQMLESARAAVAIETDGTKLGYAMANTALGHCLYIAGDLESATNVLTRVTRNERAAPLLRLLALALMAMVDRELGRTEASGLVLREAITLLDAASRALPQTVLAYTAHGECLAVDGDIAGAIATLDAGLALRRTNPGLSPWQTIHHLLATARVQTRIGNPTTADQYLDEAERLMARFHDGMDAMHQRLRAARAENRPHRSPGPKSRR